MTHFKVEDGQVPIADSPLYRITIWIFNCLFIRVFRVTILGIFPGQGFPAIARGAPILLGFPRFRSLLEPPILGLLFPLFWSRPL
jgi:hypothetical protein